MPPDDEAQNETSRSSPSRREYAFALITALLFTAVNSIGLSYIYTYYAGDIEHQVLPVVTYYLIQALSALLPTCRSRSRCAAFISGGQKKAFRCSSSPPSG